MSWNSIFSRLHHSAHCFSHPFFHPLQADAGIEAYPTHLRPWTVQARLAFQETAQTRTKILLKVCVTYQAYGVCDHRMPPLRRRCDEYIHGDTCEPLEVVVFQETDRVCPICWWIGLLLWWTGFVVTRAISYEVADAVADPSVASLFAPCGFVTEVCSFLTVILCYIVLN